MKLNKINQLLKKYDKKYWRLQNQIDKIYDSPHDIYKINGKEKVKVLRHIQTQYLKKAEINIEKKRQIQKSFIPWSCEIWIKPYD